MLYDANREILGIFLFYCYNKNMIKKKPILFLLLMLFLPFLFYQSPVSAANYCRGYTLSDPMYRACIDGILKSGKIKSISDCKNFPDAIGQGICKSYVNSKSKTKTNNKSTDTGSNNKSTNTGSTSATKTNASLSFTDSKCSYFAGLTSWNCGVEIKDENSLKTGIWKIVANVAVDIVVVAAYLVLGYVIYGGYLYIFSSGDPNKVIGAKRTLTHAFIGLAIVMSAYVIINSIRIATLGASGTFNSDCVTKGCVDVNNLVTNAIQWVIGIAGVVAAIFVVYGGISYTTSAGEPNKLQKAKQVIIYALIGLVIVGLAEVITAFVSNMIRNANTNTSQLITPKEQYEEQIS